MKDYKDDLKTIFEVLIYLIIIFNFLVFENIWISYLSFSIWILFWILNIYTKIEYRKGKKDYLLIPTVNDNYSKMTSLILGFILTSLSLVFLIWKPEFIQLELIVLIVGILLLTNGILDLPKGKIEVIGDFLFICGLDDKMKTELIKSVEIKSSKIILVDTLDKVIRIDNFNINSKSTSEIEQYLIKKLKNTTFIKKNNEC